ncbi:MAG: type II secretion system minor pseudopilin GspK [Pseudomonadota bacterium]
MNKGHSQSGAALITVLFLVVILSFIVLALGQTTTRAAQRAIATRAHAELYWRAVGLEALAKTALEAALQESITLTAESPILAAVYDVPMEGANARFGFVDQTTCFNVNSLVRSEAAAGDSINGQSRAEMMSFAEKVGISGADMDGLVSVIVDWIDADDFQESRGAEDNFYTALPTPYRTGGGILADVSEVRAMANVDEDFYQLLSPILCAHPDNEQTQINVNLLQREHAPLLAAVLGPNVQASDAENIIQERPPSGYEDINDFFQQEAVRAVQTSPRGANNNNRGANGQNGGGEGPAGGGRLAVTSKYLTARGVVEQSGMSLELNILFKLDGPEATVVSRRIGRRT